MAYGRSEFASELKALDINVPRGTLDRLEIYAGLLNKWQAKINLVGPATLPDLWRSHFLDSAQLLPMLSNSLPRAGGGLGRGRGLGSAGEQGAGGQPPPQPSPKLGGGGSPSGESGVLADLGSGAGFPGLVLAIL